VLKNSSDGRMGGSAVLLQLRNRMTEAKEPDARVEVIRNRPQDEAAKP
jgi:hypothetical protein